MKELLFDIIFNVAIGALTGIIVGMIFLLLNAAFRTGNSLFVKKNNITSNQRPKYIALVICCLAVTYCRPMVHGFMQHVPLCSIIALTLTLIIITVLCTTHFKLR